MGFPAKCIGKLLDSIRFCQGDCWGHRTERHCNRSHLPLWRAYHPGVFSPRSARYARSALGWVPSAPSGRARANVLS